jgi:hypothetical protein
MFQIFVLGFKKSLSWFILLATLIVWTILTGRDSAFWQAALLTLSMIATFFTSREAWKLFEALQHPDSTCTSLMPTLLIDPEFAGYDLAEERFLAAAPVPARPPLPGSWAYETQLTLGFGPLQTIRAIWRQQSE